MSGPIAKLLLATCLTMWRLHVVRADTLASRSQDPDANYDPEEDDKPEPSGPRNVLKATVPPQETQPKAADAKTEERLLDERMLDHENTLVEQHFETHGELDEEHQMDIYNKMKQEFGEEQMEVYHKMREAQQAEAEKAAQEEAPSSPPVKTKMRMTLKGYVHEAVVDPPPTEAPPPTEEAQNQTSSDTTKAKAKISQDDEEEEDDDLQVFNPGQQAEWNSLIGTKDYKKVDRAERERDWQLVNIVEKTVGKKGTMYTIQRGTMQVQVRADQLRKPKQAAEKHDGVGEDHREVDHSDAPQEHSDHVDVMVPLAAPVGNKCLGKAKKVGEHSARAWSPLECRNWCEMTSHCEYVSYSEADGCNMYSKCKKTGGSGYRTWIKLSATQDEADKARQAEMLEDKYMELWAVSKGITGKDKKSPSASSIKIAAADDDEEELQSGYSWSSRIMTVVLLGAIVAIFRLKVAAKMNMKALKDGKALDNLSVDGIVSWIQRESAAVVSILQKMMNGEGKDDELSKDVDTRYDVEMNSREEPKKEVQLNFPKLAQKAEEPKDVGGPPLEAENEAEAPEGHSGSEAEDGKASIFKASQGYHQKLYSNQPGGNLKDEANASLKSLMGGSSFH
eukprot:gnl/MRDRNA2_/MRDRNA2_96773_c0_seq1.p1 gnl/MRDRNA2_/MRDRNA2_96773_c0~~gnl/MRDRNA2_/MRDRNA2_96773_c0_seq1.p1  ORF type:complete len:620 (+),score=189.66 gnl/MRDRNA2_/MRDRNA2_96773_c0_seq1:81-1940(+)